MDESSEMSGSGFSFGEVEDTFYEEYKTGQNQQTKLPFNPFLFDLRLKLIRSEEGYENTDIQIQLNADSDNVFGRKSKKKVQLLAGNQPLTYEFLAPTVSKRHFCITNDQFLKDMESKKGTYIWIGRHEPKLLQIDDEFLLNETTLRIQNINKQNQKIELKLDTKIITLNPKGFKERMFLIGSHSKCNFVMSGLQEFQIGIDLHALKLFNLIEDEDCDNKRGTWMRVKDKVKIGGGDIFMAFPYVFQVCY